MRRDAGGKEAEEGSEGPADDEAHGAPEGATLEDALHHDLLARLNPGHPGRLGDDDVGVGTDLASHEVLAHGLELGWGERDVFVTHGGDRRSNVKLQISDTLQFRSCFRTWRSAPWHFRWPSTGTPGNKMK